MTPTTPDREGTRRWANADVAVELSAQGVVTIFMGDSEVGRLDAILAYFIGVAMRDDPSWFAGVMTEAADFARDRLLHGAKP